MRRELVIGTGVLAGMILLAGCNQNQNTSSNGPAQTPDLTDTGQTAGSVPAAPGEASTSTQSLIQDVALNDMYEVQAGQIAAMRSKSPDIQQFAQRMVDAHTQNLNQLKQLVTKISSDYKPPLQLDQLHQALLDDLQAASDQQFDPRYIAQQLDQHYQGLALMRGYIKAGDDSNLKDFARQSVPALTMETQTINAIDRAHRGHVGAQANNVGRRTR
jgi:putative membrane protein